MVQLVEVSRHTCSRVYLVEDFNFTTIIILLILFGPLQPNCILVELQKMDHSFGFSVVVSESSSICLR